MLDLQVVSGIGKVIGDRMKEIGINTVEKLASAKIDDLLKINGIGKSTAKKYIEFAKKCLQDMKEKDNKEDFKEKKKISNVSQKEIFFYNREPPELKRNSLAKVNSRQKFEKVNLINPEETFSSQLKQEKATPYQKMYNKLTKLEGGNQTHSNSNFKKAKTKNYSKHAKKKSIKKQKEKKQPIKTFFNTETMQRIRYLHFKIKGIEDTLKKKKENIAINELNYFYEYVKILNVNYKTQSQIKIFKELDITPNFYDPLESREIQIWDLLFECARALWVLARVYDYTSKKFEEGNKLKKAIVAKVESSKMYKTAAYFSAACTRQEDKGIALNTKNLEEKSEESRISAQNLAAIKEENEDNLALASQLYAGLSALTKRLSYLKKHEKFRDYQFKAQFHYDLGKACHLKAKHLKKSPNDDYNEENIENLQKKANYYFLKAEEIWESMLKEFKELSNTEKDSIRINLSIVNEDIMENDVVNIKDKKAIKIQDPDPFIIVPENLAPFLPRTTQYLTKYNARDFNFRSYTIYKNLISDMIFDYDKLEYLQNKKSAIGRTLKELKVLYGNNDIDINMFIYLLEKHSIRLKMIQNEIDKLKTGEKKDDVTKEEIGKSKYLVQDVK